MKRSLLSTLLLAAALLVTLPLFAAGTFTVTHTGDSGPGSLRQAILDATAAQGGTVAFAIGSGPQTIRPTTPFPELHEITIDGRTQPGFSGAPLIEIDGSLLASGILLSVYNGAVHSLVVSRGPGIGIYASDSRVSQCYIGTDHTGMVARPNQTGIEGAGLFDNNLVAGNTSSDIDIGYPSTVDENLIGTDVTGNAILSGARSTRLEVWNHGRAGRPGPITITRNVIGGGTIGIIVYGGMPAIRDNFIGVSRTGTPLPNDYGVFVYDNPDVTLTANRIAHNVYAGVWVSERGALRIQLINNSIYSNGFGINLSDGGFPLATANDAGDGDRPARPSRPSRFR
jgi:hypothetical protein